ncbi:DUF3791 domain-containing protein [Glaesserella parasuis]|uniref:Uncharacterized protein n=1 Tax=Glaesserella parasuis serovar 5 (strain SH0165) TaxID=557723 RepID=B8F4X4_GLAP5|nr:DUF3791 domain-containing protein [Glaesserella parasuis]ACL32376.1 conserved hypothetical protein [Glaesserella parasuis SH0165]EMY46106.1 hypothetical protein OE7_06365 [Glaesserella parasuis gx033]MDG6238989.1 DUF3791 domain-containing protein [Glaesserella parasuis]MDG6247793.1 DUF3791 domain-containing protein [Glaesserella parasuis]MDG6283142.1 DUF3791 domain-containing protein [Glaesserella parasuis]
MQTLNILSTKELEFSLFCIDYIARELNQEPSEIYQKLKDSCLLQDYIIQHYDILHTLGKDYLVKDIIELMKEKGVL